MLKFQQKNLTQEAAKFAIFIGLICTPFFKFLNLMAQFAIELASQLSQSFQDYSRTFAEFKLGLHAGHQPWSND